MSATPAITPAARQRLAEIATKHFHVETLETRRSDRLDFHEVSVWAMVDALEAAYLEGRADQRGAK